ncbi:MAG: FkbM family methyltransferase [Sphingobacteriales bacterium]|jgi:hypothetical protein|nr:FkbM family methyltransferase [Sphingobacteriales bacterium]
MKRLIKSLFNKFGIDLVRFPNVNCDAYRRSLIVKSLEIDLIIDVGANAGFFAKEMFKLGFEGQIVSYEPLNEPFKIMQGLSQKSTKWKAYNYALGSENTISSINIAGNSFSSSILDMLPQHLKSSPDSIL